jgi:hypothetical protein
MRAPASPQAPPSSQPACFGLVSPQRLTLLSDQGLGLCYRQLEGVRHLHTGFRLADNSVLSLDFVVGLASTSGASPSDEGPHGFTALRQNMAAYQRNGAQLGWLLIPQERAAEVWEPPTDPPTEPSAQPRRLEAASRRIGDRHGPGLASHKAPRLGS